MRLPLTRISRTVADMPETPHKNAAICTIASKNYLAHVRTLAESFRRFHPEVQVYLLLVDRLDGYFDPQNEPFTTVLLQDLSIRNSPGFRFQYTILELNTAAKPFFLEHLFEHCGHDKLLYFDPDIKFYAPVTPLFEALDSCSVTLIPHLTAPLLDQAKPNERDILRAGAYNLGFIGLARAPVTIPLLRWWQDKLYRECLVDFDAGLFTDQRWMDLVPGMFEGVRVIRDPGYDVAYWNLQHQRIERRDGEYAVNGEPLRFFHFSGFNPANRDAISKHQDRYRLHDVPCLPELFDDYESDLKRHGYEDVKQWPYAFATFDDGCTIPKIARDLYREMRDDAERFGDPFRTDADSFYAWLNEPAEGAGRGEPVITNLALALWRRRIDLQQAYPYPPGKDREGLAVWLAAAGAQEYELDARFVAALHLPGVLSGEAAGRQAAELARLSADTRRGRITAAVAHLGFGRMARRLLGARLANTVRDWVRWGRRARTPDIAPAELGLARQRDRPIEGPMGGNVVGYISSESGVGESARSVIRSLRAAEVPVAGTLVDIYCGHRKRDESCADVPEGNPYPFNLLCMNADETPQIFSKLGADFFRDKFNIGYWFWELEHFPEEWYDRFEYLDEVWVASSFCQDAVSRVSPIPVVRIPLAIEGVGPAASLPRDVLDIPPDRFLFFFMFDYYSYPERKNPLAVLRAFQQAFSAEADVHLLLKGTDSTADPAYHARLVAEARPEQVTIIDRYLDRDVINGLMQRCDCYVSLHRSEGFGITPAQAMHLGKPVVATAYSGNVDFMRPDNSYLVRYRLAEIDKDHGPYKKGWLWAEPDVDHAAHLMARVFEDREEAAQIAARGKEEIRSHYCQAAVGARIKERLERLLTDHRT
ncbi:MAG: glycosyltransferase [Armatimonadota bacterium]|nr:MAG: glycosyltransferase [Armatimonadota bacterium]